MEQFTYSVVIRTLGTGGEKYKKLLESISLQTFQPKEIIVVLPVGYKADHSLGYERTIYSEKGMVMQRATGIKNADSDYVLLVDDDISFETEFVEELMRLMKDTLADVVVPELKEVKSEKNILRAILINLKYILIGQRFLLFPFSKYKVKFSSTGGHFINLSTNKKSAKKYYITQSWAGGCFLINTEKAQNVKFEDEKWLDESGYAMYEDQVFSYKSNLLKQKAVFTPHVEYIHLDGGTGHGKFQEKDRLSKRLFHNTRNRTIGWYKFLFLPANFVKRLWLILCYTYSTVNTFIIYSLFYILKPSYWIIPFSVWKGAIDAFVFLLRNKTNSDQ